MNCGNILIFDSGFGGLTIAKEIRELLPGVKLNYLSDGAVFPYGYQSESQIKQRLKHTISQAIDIDRPDLVVVACNTASTVAIDYLREQFHIPIIGVVPAVKPAAEITQSSVIGVLATEVTTSSEYLKNLIDEHANECTVLLCGSRVLVREAENKIKGISPDLKLIEKELEYFNYNPNARKLDCLVLGCTHFPLIKKEISEFISSHIKLIDSGKAIANRVKQVLSSLDTDKPKGDLEEATHEHSTFFTTNKSNATDVVLENMAMFLGATTSSKLLTSQD